MVMAGTDTWCIVNTGKHFEAYCTPTLMWNKCHFLASLRSPDILFYKVFVGRLFDKIQLWLICLICVLVILICHKCPQLELKASIDALEAEKQNLMAELASSATGFSEEKKKMVDNVSNVLEDEFQCAICNELFINVSCLSYLLV